MKVLHVVTAFPREDNDVITPWLLEILTRLRDRGTDVEVYAPSYKGLGGGFFRGLRVRRFRYFPARWEDLTHDETVPDRLKRHWRYRVALLSYIVCGSWAIIPLARKEKYDVIHVHWPFPHALFGYFGKLAGNSKLVSTFYGVELRWVKTRMPLFLPFLRWSIEISDAVVAISRHTADEIRELSSREIVTIPYGTAVSGDASSRPERAERKSILFVGRLVERKGVEFLLRAFKGIAGEVDADLVIAGDGPDRERLCALAEQLSLTGRVFFRGRVPQAELEALYGGCDVFVLPAVIDSRGDTEGLGVVLLEAMSYKKPVIASDLGGIRDIVTHGESGLLVGEKQVPELSEALKRVLTDGDLARRLGEQGYAFLQERFSWNQIVGSLEELYSSLLA